MSQSFSAVVFGFKNNNLALIISSCTFWFWFFCCLFPVFRSQIRLSAVTKKLSAVICSFAHRGFKLNEPHCNVRTSVLPPNKDVRGNLICTGLMLSLHVKRGDQQSRGQRGVGVSFHYSFFSVETGLNVLLLSDFLFFSTFCWSNKENVTLPWGKSIFSSIKWTKVTWFVFW